ncbi:hypothetical protein [Geothrix fuzhouensis]|uniref:hypothetical protein n=1 Tax=Geothrix fuzhouensis TaxID=2966451 RepID=UPI0021472AF5|nr:hypothetical protein [Geothrix fuzhouensis]
MSVRLALALATLIGTAPPALAQTATPPAAAQPKAPEPDPDPAMLRAMKSKVFVVQHCSPLWLVNSLRALGSGTRGALLNSTEMGGLNTVSVRDFPENLAAIEEAIKRLDVPSTAQKAADVELTLHVLFASKGPVPEAGLPADLQVVVKQLMNTLTYRGYALAASFVQRVGVNGNQATYGRGQLEGNALTPGEATGSPLLFADWESDRVMSLESEAAKPGRYFLRKFYFLLRERRGAESLELARMGSDINLKEGEKVVVGTSVVKGRGIIVVISAKRVD